MASILVTGASGFIGSFIVEEALKRKFLPVAGSIYLTGKFIFWNLILPIPMS